MSHRSQTINILHVSERVAPEPIIPHDSFFLLRERVYPEADLMHILMQLRNERATGMLTVQISRGGVCFVTFSDRQLIPPDPQE